MPAPDGPKIVPVAVEFVALDVIRITEEYLDKRWPSHDRRDTSPRHPGRGRARRRWTGCPRRSPRSASRGARWTSSSPTRREAGQRPGHPEQDLRGHQGRDRSRSWTSASPGPRSPGTSAGPARSRRNTASGCRLSAMPRDGNVHTHIMKARYEDGKIVPVPEAEWRDKVERVRAELYADGAGAGRRHLRRARHRAGQEAVSVPGRWTTADRADEGDQEGF